MNALRILLAGAIDYAGLFPPASLDMETAVRNFTAYRSGEHAWALGRFIVPVARLSEFERALITTGDGASEVWLVSVLAGPNLDGDVAAMFGFNKRNSVVIDSVELKASTVDDVRAISAAIPSVLTAFIEIPLDSDPAPLIHAIGKSGAWAKARTGGVTRDAFPSSAHLARFIHLCARARVPFKATAGLHHLLRSSYRLTYEPGSPTEIMYGFLNVFLAAGIAYNGGSVVDVMSALEEELSAAFHFHEDGISWRQYRIDGTQIASLRREFAVSFGSCSFIEPIEDLKSLRLL